MKELLILSTLMAAVFLSACHDSSHEAQINAGDRPDTSATFLGTVDGCRLWDVKAYPIRSFAFANCGAGSTTSATVFSGKTSHEESFSVGAPSHSGLQ
jgi:hypothetical protein